MKTTLAKLDDAALPASLPGLSATVAHWREDVVRGLTGDDGEAPARASSSDRATARPAGWFASMLT
jgi:hypothetical protein